MVTHSQCADCQLPFAHEEETNTAGYYAIVCTHINCGATSWRCSSCQYTLPPRRRSVMIQHQLNHHSLNNERAAESNNLDDSDTVIDVDFDPPEDISRDDQRSAVLPSTTIINDAIIEERPSIFNLLYSDNTITADDELDAADAEEADLITEDLESLLTDHFQDEEYSQGNITTQSDFNMMGGDHNRIFFCQQHNDNHGGIRGVVHRASSRNHKFLHINDMVDELDAKMMFQITDNLVGKSLVEQKKYLSSIETIMSRYDSEPNTNVTIPTDLKTANSTCTRSKYSIFNLLPYPPTKVISGHACLELDGLLDHCFAWGLEFLPFQDHDGNKYTDGFNGTKAGQRLYNQMKNNLVGDVPAEQTFFGHLMFWSDSFLRFFSRQRDNSIWMLIVRICPPMGMSTSESHTYCLAFGSKSLDHEPVIKYYLEQLDEIRRGKMRYYGREGVMRKINTVFDLVLYAADMPERKELLRQLLLGNFGKRTNVAGMLDQKRLPSCSQCFRKMVRLARCLSDGVECDNLTLCPRCCNWDQFSESNARQIHECPPNYPTTCSVLHPNPHIFPTGRTVRETHLVAVMLSFTTLSTAVKAAFHEFSVGEWNKTQTRYWLSSMAVDGVTQERVIAAGDRKKKGETVHETDYVPHLWTKAIDLGYEASMFVELGMHLLGHGVVSSIIDLTEQVLKEHNQWATYQRFANDYLNQIASFRLDWCHVKELPKTNWLGEDCFGYARLQTHLYGQFFLRHEFAVGSNINACLLELKRLISSCDIMISLLMTKQHVTTEQIDAAIKVFLSCCHEFCNEYYDEGITDFWMTKGNFISLLNLPQQIDIFGSLALYYDGVFERSIQSVKKILQSARKNENSLLKKMILIHKHIAMKRIGEQLGVAMDEKDEEAVGNRYQGGVRIFEDIEQIEQLFLGGKCMSCFYIPQLPNQINVPYAAGRDEYRVVSYEFSNTMVSADGCSTYATFKRIPVSNRTFHKSTLDMKNAAKNNIKFGLMLPYKASDNDAVQGRYSLRTHEWLNLLPDGSVNLPKYSSFIFNV